MSWETLKANPDYEICTEYPFRVREKGSNNLVLEDTTTNKWLRVMLNDKQFLKHRLIAEQFLEDFTEKSIVVHHNNNTFDNHLENLWVTTRGEYRKYLNRLKRNNL